MEMGLCRNVTVSSNQQPDQLGSLDHLFSPQNMEVDMSMEWLSGFMEDCLSSKETCLLPPLPAVAADISSSVVGNSNPEFTEPQEKTRFSLETFVVPSKARSKRKRPKTPLSTNCWLDPPMIQQSHWLADSELITLPLKNQQEDRNKGKLMMEAAVTLQQQQQQQQLRKCSHCQSQRTPQWRAGPMGPKTLCNACGVRFKSGRLLPEYRPAKSPSFVTFLHSNSHKKVLQMRSMDQQYQ